MLLTPSLSHLRSVLRFVSGALAGVTLFFLFYSGVPAIFAADPPKTPPLVDAPAPVSAPQGPIDESCYAALPPRIATERAAFLQFMNQHFKNHAPSSQLLEDATTRFDNFRAALYGMRAQYLLQAKLQADAVSEIAYCNQLVEQEITTAEAVTRSYVSKMISVKRSTALSEKLGSINGRLRNLNDLLAQFSGYFSSFDHKFSGFTQQCIKK